VKTIHFEDNGQDYTRWLIDDAGMVVDSQPFQAWIWTGSIVLNHKSLKPGDQLHLQMKDGHEMTIKHLVGKVVPFIPVKKKGARRCPYQPRVDMEAIG
jgi:hypothetical protein